MPPGITPQTHARAAGLTAYGALAVSMMLVGANVPLAKYLGAHIPALWIGLARASFAAACLLPLLMREGPLRWPGQGASLLAALGLFGVVLYPVFLLVGLSSTGAFEAGLIAATLPAVVALLAFLLLREPLSARLLGGIVLAVAGLALLSAGSAAGAKGTAPLLGNALVLAAVVAEGLYVITARVVSKDHSPVAMAFWGNLAAAVLFVPLVLVGGGAEEALEAPTLAWAGVAFFSLTSSVIALILWFYGISRVSPAVAGLFTLFLPVTASLISILVLGENLAPLGAAGFALIALAILLGARGNPAPRH